MWEDLARLAASSLFKGNQVYVRGRLGIESYQPPNGPLRETMQVVREMSQNAVYGTKDKFWLGPDLACVFNYKLHSLCCENNRLSHSLSPIR